VIAAVLAVALATGCGRDRQPYVPDSPSTVDARLADGADAAFPCLATGCTPDQVCYQLAAGRATADAGFPDAGPPPDARVEQPGCIPIPPACATDPTCACLVQNVTTNCPFAPTCQLLNGHPYLTCNLP
jgi:hypothetical protein